MSLLDSYLPAPDLRGVTQAQSLPNEGCIGFAARLAAEDRAVLIAGRRVETFEVGATVWHPGSDSVTLLTGGTAATMAALPDGLEAGSAIHAAGDVPGLGEALVGHSSIERGVALTPATAIRLSATTVKRLWRDSGGFRDAAVAQMTAEAASARRWCACQSRHGVDERVAGLLSRLAQHVEGNTIKTTQEAAAQVLGIQRTTVSQSASKLQHVGVLQWRRGSVDILDASRLNRFACGCGIAEDL